MAKAKRADKKHPSRGKTPRRPAPPRAKKPPSTKSVFFRGPSPHGIYVGVDVGATKIGINAVDAARDPVSANWSQVPARTEDGPRATVRQIVDRAAEGVKGVHGTPALAGERAHAEAEGGAGAPHDRPCQCRVFAHLSQETCPQDMERNFCPAHGDPRWQRIAPAQTRAQGSSAGSGGRRLRR